MALLPDLVGRIRLDMSELDRARGEATSRGAAIGSALGSAVGSLAGGLLSAAGAKVSEFVTGSVDAFAKLQDATSVAGVKFGDAAGTIERFAATAATSFGMSKTQATEAANTFGTFGTAVGLTGEPLAQFSTKMTGLAGDMASFTGTSPAAAIDAIGAAFRGEFDPIEKYGVLINQAKVQQEAERLGLVEHGKTMTDHARILATQSLIYQQTSQAQGDFARTGDSVANTQKRIAAETENAQAALGQKLAPAYLAVLNALNPLIGAITTFVGLITNVVSFVWQWRDAIAAVLIVLGILNAQTIAANVAMAAWLIQNAAVRVATTAWTAVQWLLNAALTANPIGLVIAAIAALAAGIIVAYNHSETFRNYVNGLWQEWQQFVGWLNANVPGFVSAIVNGFTQANAATDSFWQRVGQLPGQIGGAFQQANTATDNFWHGVANAFTQANAATDGFWQHVGEVPGKVEGFLAPLAGRFMAWLADGMRRAVDGVNQANQALFGYIGSIPERINSALGGVPGRIWELIKGGWDRMVAGVQQANATLFGYVTEIPSKIVSTLTALPQQLYDIGVQTIDGLLRGLQVKGQEIVTYLTNLIPEPVRRALNIASPSGVMRDIGENVMQGLDQGLQKWIPKIQSTLKTVLGLIQQTGHAAGQVQFGGQSIGYDISKTDQGISGSATVGGQQVSGSINRQGQASVTAGGHTYNVDARSFGTQLKPQDVADAIKWASKIGGLVSA